MERPQINIRFDNETRDTLEAAAFVRRQTVPGLLGEIVKTHTEKSFSEISPEQLAADHELQGKDPDRLARAVRVVTAFRHQA